MLSPSNAPAEPRNGQPSYYEISASYDSEYWRSAGSAMAQGDSSLGLGSISLAVDGTAWHLPAFTFYTLTLLTHGSAPNEQLAATAQGISNIEAPSAWRLYELWSEWQLNDRHSLKLGLYDVNSEFDVIDTAALFINPSQGIGPDFAQSGDNGPSIFPTTSLALRSWHHRGPWTLQLAILDGVPGDPEHPNRSVIKLDRHDGLLLLSELGFAQPEGLRVATGYWRYTNRFDTWTTSDATADGSQHNYGYYGLVDIRLLQQQAQRTGLNVFLRFGSANQNINVVGHYLGTGIVLTGPLPSRPGDQLGIALAQAAVGEPFKQLQSTEAISLNHQERNVELTYAMLINPWLTVQPDAQYVSHPSFDAQRRHEWMLGIRLSLNLDIRR